jgi:chromosome segregation ATPase
MNQDKENSATMQALNLKRPPPLAISVTMSEAEDDDNEVEKRAIVTDLLEQIHQNIDDSNGEEGSSQNNASVWAMMEHYEGTPDESPRKSVNTFEASNDEGASLRSAVMDSSRIQWAEDENGELIQSSFYTLGSSHTGPEDHGGVEVSDEELSRASQVGSPAAHGRHVIFRSGDPTEDNVQEQKDCRFSCPNVSMARHTPAKVHQRWKDDIEVEEGDLSSEPGSLLQVSMVQSVQASSETPVESSRTGIPNDASFTLPSIDIENMTQLSLASLQASEAEHQGLLQNGSVSTEHSPGTGTKRPIQRGKVDTQNEAEKKLYLSKIEDLERSLRAQRCNTNEVQGKLQERVMELEHALRVTAATPRGTIIQENPLKTLLDRNQTLVKEVRFADQTCVELSSKISALKTENGNLKEQIAVLSQENDDLREENAAYKSGHNGADSKRQKDINDLNRELELARADLQAKTIAEENLLKLVREAAGDLNISIQNNLSLASSVLSGTGTSGRDRSSSIENSDFDPSPFPHETSDLLQRFVIALSEKAKKTCQTDDEEMEPIRRENEFLGRQLGIVQQKLDDKESNLESERSRSTHLEMTLRRTAEAQKNLLEPLEQKLEEALSASDAPCAEVETRLLSLKRDFAHVKATLVAIKRESQQLLSGQSLNSCDMGRFSNQEELVAMVKGSFTRMGQRYKHLESDVGELVDAFSNRLDELTDTVSLLRRSLVFETDSVSAPEREEHPEQEIPFENPSNNVESNSSEVLAATIHEKPSSDDDDELYRMMEEARSPHAKDFEVMSDLDDMSRLLSDDMTLESAVRTGSVFSSVTNADRFKEPLEAAIKECQRVRERSGRLKEQIESQKTTIRHLEQENGRLSLNASRRTEETNLVETALEEAKKQIESLQASLHALRGERDSTEQLVGETDRERKVVQEANARLTKELYDVNEHNRSLEDRLRKQETLTSNLQKELDELYQACEELKQNNDELLVESATKEYEVTQKKEREITEIRRLLQDADRERSEYQRWQQDATTKLSQEAEERRKLEALVSELQNSQKQLLSDVEDRDLESQFEREDMRKERAELKRKLKETEKEAANLKESFSTFKEKLRIQMEEKDALVESLESQQRNVLTSVGQLVELRSQLLETMESIGITRGDLLVSLQPENSQYPGALDADVAAINEIDVWKELMPKIEKEIVTLNRAMASYSNLQIEAEDLKDQLSKMELQDAEHEKSLSEEKQQNAKLFDLLRQAEQEMEICANQVRDMSESIATFQANETEATSKAEATQAEMTRLKEDFEKLRLESMEESERLKRAVGDKAAQLEEKDSFVFNVSAERDALKADLEEATYKLRSKESENKSMKFTVDSLEKKTTRLREYVRKLTTKCEEWEESYEKQTLAIEKLQEKNSRMREKALQIAEKYKRLAENVQRRKRMHKEDRAKWSSERTNLNHVHVQLEQELEQIAKELTLPVENIEY